jgi:hypothetical protein
MTFPLPIMMLTSVRLAACLILPLLLPDRGAAQIPSDTAGAAPTLIVPEAVWDGVSDAPSPGWVVLVRGNRIEAAGPKGSVGVPSGAIRIELPGTTLIPGLIEGHSHLFLHPYNEATWDDQVLREPLGQRMARAVASAAATLHAGVTTERDLGTEGAFDYDVQLKRAIEHGIVPGPRIITTTRAIVATGSYGPRRSDYSFEPLQGAEEASGPEEVTRVVRRQIGYGADWIKVYADYRWGPGGEAKSTFTAEELDALVRTAREAGRPVAAHATTAEGMRRAVQAGVATIEHGDGGPGTCSSSCGRKAWRSVPRSPPPTPTPSTSKGGPEDWRPRPSRSGTSGPAFGRRWMPGWRSVLAAMWVSSPTETMCESSRPWSMEE